MLNLHSKLNSLLTFFYFKLFICPLNVSGLRHEFIAELTTPQVRHLHFATFENSIFVQKRILVKLLG